MKNQFRVTTNKGESYLAYAGDLGGPALLAGDAIRRAMNAFLCPLGAIAKVEHEGEHVSTVLYDEKGNGYTGDDLSRLFHACRRH